MKLKAFLFLIILTIAITQVIQIYPTDDYSQSTASSRACFANCQFCQIKTGFCQECLSPYFQKDVNGNCVLVPGYVIQSSSQQILVGDLFTPSNVSWSNNKVTNCQANANYFTDSLKILGPFGQTDGIITYRRSVSNHKYMKLKFFLLKMKWDQTDSLNIVIKNQNDVILVNQTINNTPKVPKQQLCSSTKDDQRFSISFDFVNIGSTSIFISFTPNLKKNINAKWAISSFLLLTGRCHQTCDDCDRSFQPTKCKGCKKFFIQGSDLTCNQCADGFKKQIKNGITRCTKCPIQFKQCKQNKQVCFYNDIKQELNLKNCTFNSNNNYVSNYLINDLQFSGNLFTIGGSSSIYKCGDYSIVGLANKGQPITRIFTFLQVHQSVSITFNVFIVDQKNSQKNIFEIYLDNVRIQTLFINTQGISNTCGGPDKEVFQTYPATKFFQHNQTQNVNITIRSSNTANWGIRNFRLALHVCDQTCLQCSPDGCKTCTQFFGIKNLRCTQCPKGSSPSLFDNSTCFACSSNCLECAVRKNNKNLIQTQCKQCEKGFFVFQGLCQKQSNTQSPIQKPSTSWLSPNQIFLTNNCTIQLTGNIKANDKNLTFIVAQDKLNNTYKINQPHYKIFVSFYLLKIDNWLETQEINLYLNDLLVLKKIYTDYGNRICYQKNENDLITYQTIQYEDSNQTLKVQFQVINGQNGTKRKFGIADFKIKPVSCKQCENFNFQYKIDYNYDQVLRVQIIFNRVYINNDPDLFKKIFKLYVNNQTFDYQIVGNDSIRYLLQHKLQKQIQLTNVSVLCKYPEKVTTNIEDSIHQSPFFTNNRIMQASKEKKSILSNNKSNIEIIRFTPLDNPSAGQGLRIFFQVVTRAVIYLGFASFFLGCMTPCTHFMHNIQKIWVHIFVASLTIPNLLKFCLKGFRQSQDQNITINPSQWQKGIPQYLYYQVPAYYQDYYHDINFFRNIYNIGFSLALYFLFGVIAFFIFKSNLFGRVSNNKVIRHLKITFYRRPFFVFNSVIFYQYFTTCLACTLQFLDLKSKSNQNTFSNINAAATVITFILATIYPIIHFLYLTHKQNDMYSIDYEIVYRNRYQEIFYRFLPKNIWKIPNDQFRPIGFKQRFYNVLRFGELWWISIVVTAMYDSPFSQAFILVIMNFLHLLFIWISSISMTGTFKFLKVLQLLFFIGLQLIILVSQSQNQTLTSSAYKTLGVVGIVFIFLIIVLSFIRFIYTFKRIYDEYQEVQPIDKQGKTIDQRIRIDELHASYENNNQKIRSEES